MYQVTMELKEPKENKSIDYVNFSLGACILIKGIAPGQFTDSVCTF